MKRSTESTMSWLFVATLVLAGCSDAAPTGEMPATSGGGANGENAASSGSSAKTGSDNASGENNGGTTGEVGAQPGSSSGNEVDAGASNPAADGGVDSSVPSPQVDGGVDSSVPAPQADAGVDSGPVWSNLTCTRCKDFANAEMNGQAINLDDVCDGSNAPASSSLYDSYLGCVCSGPCALECATTLCALKTQPASLACKTCLGSAAVSSTCGAEKSACFGDD